MASDVKQNSIKSPALIIVGRVCSLSKDFDWFSRLPLIGKSILVTQPKSKASRLAALIRDAGGNPILYPVIETKYIRPINPPIDDFKVLAFTSSVGVEAFFDDLLEKGKDARSLCDKMIIAVGSQTAEALKTYGVVADFVPSMFDGKTMIKEFSESGKARPDDGVLLLRAEKGSEETIEELEKWGARYMDYPVYRTNYVEHDPIDMDNIDFITFTSKSCVSGLLSIQDKYILNNKKAVCIGRQTQELASENG